MPMLPIDDGCIYYKVSGSGGEPIALVHGSLSDHTSWDAVVPILARKAHVIAYDRRGHSRSRSTPKQDSILGDVSDLAEIIQHVVGGPAHIVGTSSGAAISLRLAGSRPELVRTLVAHEPPLIAALPAQGEWQQCRQDIEARFQQFVTRCQDGDEVGAVRYFVDEIADGYGAWERLPNRSKEIFARNALTLLHEFRDDAFLQPDLDSLSSFAKPLLFSQGRRSARFFRRIIDVLITEALPNAQRYIYSNAGHVPHQTHPHEHAAVVSSFIRESSPPLLRDFP